MDGNGGGGDLGGEVGLVTEMMEVGGEAVAEIDGGGGEFPVGELAADGKAGLEVEVGVFEGGGRQAEEFLWGAFEREKFGGRSSEGTADIDEVAGAGGGAEEGLASLDGSDQDDVGDDEALTGGGGWGFGGVAAGEGNIAERGEGEESVEKAFDPAFLAATSDGQVSGYGEGEKGGEGASAHCREVAEPAGEAAVADRLRRVPVAAKVDVFEGEVGGDGDFFAGFGLEEGAVVADSEAQGGASGLFSGAEGGDEGEFPAMVR
jgi:hypothetical protein